MPGCNSHRRTAHNHLLNAINNVENALTYLGPEGSQDWHIYNNLLEYQRYLVGLLTRMEIQFEWKNWDGSPTATQTCCTPQESVPTATDTPTGRTSG